MKLYVSFILNFVCHSAALWLVVILVIDPRSGCCQFSQAKLTELVRWMMEGIVLGQGNHKLITLLLMNAQSVHPLIALFFQFWHAEAHLMSDSEMSSLLNMAQLVLPLGLKSFFYTVCAWTHCYCATALSCFMSSSCTECQQWEVWSSLKTASSCLILIWLSADNPDLQHIAIVINTVW